MSDRLDIDRLVTDWMNDEAPPRAPHWVLSTAVERVADVGQVRPFGPSFGGWPGDSARLRWAILAVGLATLVLGGIAGAGAGLFREATISPPGVANGWVAFTVEGWTRQSESDIYLVRDGVEERRLTGSDVDLGREVCPQFSPDGTKLAYAEGPANAVDDGGVFVVIETLDVSGRPVGAAVRTSVPSWGGVCPRWSPDGQSVAFVDSDSNLWTLRVDGTVAPIGGWGETNTVNAVDWSPDGTAVVATGFGGSRIWIVPIDGREAQLFQSGEAGVGPGAWSEYEEARWSPDGTRIAVVARGYAGAPDNAVQVSSGIRIFDVAGVEDPVDFEGGVMFAWSPDGHRIAYVRSNSKPVGEVSDLVLATTAGDDTGVIASDHRLIRGLSWAPDGTQVLYVAHADASGQLMSVSATGDSAPVVLTQHGHLFEWTESDDISWQPVFP